MNFSNSNGREPNSRGVTIFDDWQNPMTGYSIIPIIFSSVGTFCSIVPHGFCNFAELKPVQNALASGSVGLGLAQWEGFEDDGETCVSYDSSTKIDALWRLSQFFAIVGGILAGTTCFWFWLSGIAPSRNLEKNRKRWNLLALGSACSSICSLLSLLFLEGNACNSANWSSDGCRIGEGGKLVIAGGIMLFLTSITGFFISPPERLPSRSPRPTQEVQLQAMS
mmetsp:Transcript_369/g.477  ORF Transcript_369/g.477 Transcript_369/m.477 type:complete len:223 (-) Transcript_369:291-959(-)